jgi:hypothetical protein
LVLNAAMTKPAPDVAAETLQKALRTYDRAAVALMKASVAILREGSRVAGELERLNRAPPMERK